MCNRLKCPRAFGFGRRRLALTVAAATVPDTCSLTAPKDRSSRQLGQYDGLCDNSADLALPSRVTTSGGALELLHTLQYHAQSRHHDSLLVVPVAQLGSDVDLPKTISWLYCYSARFRLI